MSEILDLGTPPATGDELVQQSITATLIQLGRYSGEVRYVNGVRSCVVPEWAMLAMRSWLREASEECNK